MNENPKYPDLMKMLESRRMYRRFDQSRNIPEQVVSEMLQAARMASCAVNAQKLRYYVIEDPQLVEKVFPLTFWAARLPKEEGTPKPGEHPVLYVLTAFDRNTATPWIGTDAGLALSNMTLAAWNHGVGSCILGSVNKPALKELLNLDENMEIHTLTAFGYPTHASHLVEGQQGNLGYYLDENKDYCVPKLPVEEIATIL